MIKVLVNAFQDKPSFAFSEMLDAPFIGHLRLLAVVAAIFTVASWNNIAKGIRTILSNGDEMILRQLVPQTLWPSAISACIVPVQEAVLPILKGKIAECLTFSGKPLLFLLTFVNLEFFSMALSIFPHNFGVLRFVSCVVVSAYLAPSLWMEVLISFRRFSFNLQLFRMISVIAPLLQIPAFAALAFQITYSPAFVLRKMRRSEQDVLSTFGTLLERKRGVEHSVFTSHCLPDEISASDGKDRRSGATLADIFSIPQFGYIATQRSK